MTEAPSFMDTRELLSLYVGVRQRYTATVERLGKANGGRDVAVLLDCVVTAAGMPVADHVWIVLDADGEGARPLCRCIGSRVSFAATVEDYRTKKGELRQKLGAIDDIIYRGRRL